MYSVLYHTHTLPSNKKKVVQNFSKTHILHFDPLLSNHTTLLKLALQFHPTFHSFLISHSSFPPPLLQLHLHKMPHLSLIPLSFLFHPPILFPRTRFPSHSPLPTSLTRLKMTSHPDFDVPTFLQTHWNKKPLYLPSHLPTFHPPLTPDELAGLSCDPSITSRLIFGTHPGPYTLHLGPFSEQTFSTLPSSNWTLLVHDVNRHIPFLAHTLLSHFSFIPNWRVDDVMVSYATTGGSVGPHVDNYDVFLVQGAGKRLWKVSYQPVPPAEEHLLEDCDVRVLKDGFVSDDEWVLQQGDVLYVPPRFPHHGIALDDDCMTYSVGFRTPAVADMLQGWVDELVETGHLRHAFYHDDANDLLANADQPGRISQNAVNNAFELVMRRMRDSQQLRHVFAEWFAKEVSQPKRFRQLHTGAEESVLEDEAEQWVHLVLRAREEGSTVQVYQQEGSVFTYMEIDDAACMYIDGERWPVDSIEIAKALCDRRALDVLALAELASSQPSLTSLLKRLFAADLLYVEEDDSTDIKNS